MNRFFYTLLLYLLLPFTPLKLLWRARNQPEYLQHWGERYGFYSLIINKPIIWIHCVSVGETRAATPLVHALLNQYPNHQILLTHTTPTGRATSTQLFEDKVKRVYLPYDVPFAIKRFIKHFKPTIGVLMETELWFNLIACCKQNGIPILLINARLSERSSHGYAKLGKLAKEGFQNLTAIAAQTKQDADRLNYLGAHNVNVVGNLKFDVIPPESAYEQGQLMRNLLGNHRPVFLAASTRDGEEEIVLDAVASSNISDLLVIIVPRHPHRFNEVAGLLKKRGISFLRRSELSLDTVTSKVSSTSVIIGDSLGEMFTYYSACDVAFIGGSLLPLGGQNLIEACAMGKPVLIGPHTFNFSQPTELAIAAGAAQRVNDSEELAFAINNLMMDRTKRQSMGQAGLKFFNGSCGATQRTLSILQSNINDHYI